ncbi:MAG: hypothetical protein JWM80_1710 [Cyanobacteria bacterium RYN_339]|nr:hypothetical protein [Cyanobacteria bacterium RYN_339]
MRFTWLAALALTACSHAPLPPAAIAAPTGPAAFSFAQDAAALDRVFDVADTNHDGRLSPAELGVEPVRFHQLDRNGDGAVGRQEWDTDAPPGTPTWARGALAAYLDATSKLALQRVIHPKHVPLVGVPPWPYQDLRFQAADGVGLRGWYVPATGVATRNTVVLVHGHASNRAGWLADGQAGMLHPAYNLVMLDLRNNGESEGDTTTFGWKEALDVRAAVDWCYAQGHDRVVLMGVSMGAATVIRAASQDPRPLAVVEDSSYAVLSTAVAGFVGTAMVPAPTLIAAATLVRATKELGQDLAAFDPVTEVAALAPRPLLLLHGAADPVIPSDAAKILDVAAGAAVPHHVVLFSGAGHGQSAVAHPAQYREALLAFLTSAFSPAD